MQVSVKRELSTSGSGEERLLLIAPPEGGLAKWAACSLPRGTRSEDRHASIEVEVPDDQQAIRCVRRLKHWSKDGPCEYYLIIRTPEGKGRRGPDLEYRSGTLIAPDGRRWTIG